LLPKRDATLFGLVAILHLVASIALLTYVFGAGMARFDSGVPSTFPETLGDWLLNVLSFPLLLALEQSMALRFPGVSGYIPFLVNASLWGMAAVLIRRLWKRQPSRRAVD
jgi:hypothetical protein